MQHEKVNPWIFSPEEMRELRDRANVDAREFIHRRNTVDEKSPVVSIVAQSFAKYKSTDSDHGQKMIESSAEQNNKFPTVKEELILLNFYCTKLPSLIGPNASTKRLERDIKVASTASILLRRFFLSNSIVLFDPKAIMVACAFLASKVEDVTCDIRYLEDGTKAMQAHVSIGEIIRAEIDLVKGVDFDLCCFHPYKVVLAYTEDLRTFLKSSVGKKCVNKETVNGEDLRPIYDGARHIVEKVMFCSDIMLLASAGKVGLAAMMLANERLVAKQEKEILGSNMKAKMEDLTTAIKIDFKGYMKFRFSDKDDIESSWQDIIRLCDILKTAMLEVEPDLVALKSAHKKLKKCRLWGKPTKKRKRGTEK